MAVFGLLNLYKPSGPTSHDIVARVRRGTHVKKVGHAGTLDPLATGVLVLCLGPATRLSEYLIQSPKRYRARVRFGVETDTDDAEGAVIAEHDDRIEREAVEAALEAFRGAIAQVPPMYSAIKQGGRKLYDLARAGQEVVREARRVTIYHLELTGWEPPFAALEVECSPGTYIRSLARDLGRAVGTGAHLAALERSASGSFTAAEAIRWPDFEATMRAGTWQDYLLPPDRALQGAFAVHLLPGEVEDIRQGRGIPAREESGIDGGLGRAYDPEGRFFAVLERRGDHWQPRKVFEV
jgi:tRNA pseudouridine55 synthase